MKMRDFQPSRRRLLTEFGAAAVVTALPGRTAVSQIWRQNRPTLSLRLEPSTISLHDNRPASLIWRFAPASQPAAHEYTQGDDLQVSLTNDLPVPVALNWRGIAGMPQLEPLIVQPALPPGQTSTLNVLLRHAGTVVCDARLLGDGQAYALPAKAFSILEKQPLEVDRDHTLLIEDWRLRADGSVASPGRDAAAGQPVFTINGRAT